VHKGLRLSVRGAEEVNCGARPPHHYVRNPAVQRRIVICTKQQASPLPLH
jgi:hypothetical protein